MWLAITVMLANIFTYDCFCEWVPVHTFMLGYFRSHGPVSDEPVSFVVVLFGMKWLCSELDCILWIHKVQLISHISKLLDIALHCDRSIVCEMNLTFVTHTHARAYS